jgi:hypothetical protein
VSVLPPWKSYVLQDRELISGQNPFSDEALLKLLLPALRAKGTPSHISSPSPTSTDRLSFTKSLRGRILSRGDSKSASGHIEIANAGSSDDVPLYAYLRHEPSETAWAHPIICVLTIFGALWRTSWNAYQNRSGGSR